MVLAMLTLLSLGLSGLGEPRLDERGADAARMFAPWLLVWAAAMPERRLLAGRNRVLLGVLIFAAWLTLASPDHIWPKLRDVFPLGWLPWRSGTVAACIVMFAAILCMWRWVRMRAPMELALGLGLIVAGIALLPQVSNAAASNLLILCGAMALIAILLASYRMAFVDGLAGLSNRRALDEALARLSGDYALAMVDVDHFKIFNDRNGHAAGDRALKAVARQLKSTSGCSAFRYGGEEFCLLFVGTRARQARETCEDLRSRVADMRVQIRSDASRANTKGSRRKDAGTAKVTISIGLANRSERLRSPVDVLKAADKALYAAKSQGRNRVVTR